MKFWKKLKYWQKGTLIGFLIGNVIVYFTYVNLTSFPESLGRFLYGYLFDN